MSTVSTLTVLVIVALLLCFTKGRMRVVLYLVALGALALFVSSTGFHHP